MANRKWQLNSACNAALGICNMTWRGYTKLHGKNYEIIWQRIVRIFDTDIWCPHIRWVTPTDTAHCMAKMCNTTWRQSSTLHAKDIPYSICITNGANTSRLYCMARIFNTAWRQYLTSHGKDVQLQVVISHMSAVSWSELARCDCKRARFASAIQALFAGLLRSREWEPISNHTTTTRSIDKWTIFQSSSRYREHSHTNIMIPKR